MAHLAPQEDPPPEPPDDPEQRNANEPKLTPLGKKARVCLFSLPQKLTLPWVFECGSTLVPFLATFVFAVDTVVFVE